MKFTKLVAVLGTLVVLAACSESDGISNTTGDKSDDAMSNSTEAAREQAEKMMEEARQMVEEATAQKEQESQ